MQNEETLASPIVKEVDVAASTQEVWKAITDKNEMKKWYFDLEAFEAVPGFHFTFWGEKDGERFLHHCTITEVVPGKKIAYTWRYDLWPGESLVSFELSGHEQNRTTLKLIHSGLETFPQNEMLKKENFELGWREIIEGSLKKHFEKEKK